MWSAKIYHELKHACRALAGAWAINCVSLFNNAMIVGWLMPATGKKRLGAIAMESGVESVLGL